MIEYMLLEGSDRGLFQRDVRAFLKNGWKFHGSPFCSVTGMLWCKKVTFYQGFTRQSVQNLDYIKELSE